MRSRTATRVKVVLRWSHEHEGRAVGMPLGPLEDREVGVSPWLRHAYAWRSRADSCPALPSATEGSSGGEGPVCSQQHPPRSDQAVCCQGVLSRGPPAVGQPMAHHRVERALPTCTET